MFSCSWARERGLFLATGGYFHMPMRKPCTQRTASLHNRRMPTHEWAVDGVTVSALVDCWLELPIAKMFPDTGEKLDAYRTRFPDLDATSLRSPVRAFLLRSAERSVLVDCGLGQASIVNERFGARGGLLAELTKARIEPREITDVVITHFHADHLGGVMHSEPSGFALTYPHARHHIHTDEWRYLTQRAEDSAMASHLATFGALTELALLRDEFELGRGVVVYHTPGHTPGSLSVRVGSGSDQVLIVGDVVHHPIQVENPDWRDGYDLDHPVASRTRRELLGQCAADGTVLAPSHFPTPFGRVSTGDAGYRWSAL